MIAAVTYRAACPHCGKDTHWTALRVEARWHMRAGAGRIEEASGEHVVYRIDCLCAQLVTA